MFIFAMKLFIIFFLFKNFLRISSTFIQLIIILILFFQMIKKQNKNICIKKLNIIFIIVPTEISLNI